jgi:peptidoglycan/xylan/chitin deacetylase (PgdA/CDA1 family)
VESLGKFPDPFRVALTFDAEHGDRPRGRPENASRILDALEAAGARATFFVQGRWALAYPELARRIADDGHLVGNHSHFHSRMTLFSEDGLRADVAEAQEAVSRATGTDPRPWFRCPFGDGHDDPRVLGLLEELGYRNVFWRVMVEDWEPYRTGPALVHDALDGIEAHGDGVILLLHTWPDGTADAVPEILGGLRDRGASFVGVDELPAELLP